MITTNMHEAKSRLSEIVVAAERGEEVIICRNGKPVVRLVSIPSSAPMRDLTPAPGLLPVLSPGYNPTETLTDDEWPMELQ